MTLLKKRYKEKREQNSLKDLSQEVCILFIQDGNMNGETISGENKQRFATQSVRDAYFSLYSVRISHLVLSVPQNKRCTSKEKA